MKLFSLQILYKTDTSAKLLQASHELSDFGYFQRSSVREFMDFTAKVATEDFALQCPASTWANMTVGSDPCKKIHEYLQKYQNPTEADGLMRLQNELDETKVILHSTLESLLSRGEKLDDLVERSEGLSLQSKMFYTTVSFLLIDLCCYWPFSKIYEDETSLLI
ncbi:unnamed protein product [Schistosoma mattheei]|uniref:Uncharacterized protein n=1 Tax=Schistosoma mattheei TaxID=31246 RepID=A0A183PB39_9TREM|nr:unnamed protein product [Schistosoma mattheei]